VNFSNIHPENIPEELKAIPHWILWDYREKDGETVKVPIDPKTGAWVSAHDSKNWMTFDEAMNYAKKLNVGIGFDFTEDLGYVFIDWDHILKDEIIENPKIKEIIENGDTFTEISPGGEGLHQIFKSLNFKFDSTRLKGLPIEIYTNARYSTFTGMSYGELKPIREIEPEDLKLLLGLKEEREEERETEQRNGKLDDVQKRELTQLLEQNWDLDKPESEGNHHQVAETTIVYLKEAGISKEETTNFLIPFNRSHPLKDGKIHPERDLIYLIDYVYAHNYEKTSPAGSVSKEFKRQIYLILHRNETGSIHGQDFEKERGRWLDKNGNVQRDIIINDILKHFSKIISDEDTIYIWNGDRYSDQGREIIAKYIQKTLPEISSRMVSDIVNAIANITFETREGFERMRLPDDLIPVKNGLLDWKTKTLKPHNPDFFYSKRLNVNYNPDARCPGFIKYLLSRFEGNYREFFKVLEDLAMIFFRDNRFQIVSIWVGQSKDPSGLVSGEEGKTLTAEVIIGENFLGPELFSRASLQSLAEKDTEFEALENKWLHVASLDEAGHITNYSGLLEQLRDPYIEKPIKFKRGQLRWKNTTYNILTGNRFPKATANTKAFYRTIRKIVYWRKPIGEDWKYKDQIDEEEKSGILNLAVDIMNIITARGKPYGLNDLEHAISEYRGISDTLLMLASQIFEKDPESEIEQNEALEYMIQEGEARELVMETLTKNKLTTILKNNFGITTKRTTENKEVEDEDGNKTKIKIHKDFYKGIKKRDPKDIKTKNENSTQLQLLDTLEEAVLDYVSDIPKDKNIQISKIVLPILYIYNVEQDRKDLDIWISELKTCLENPNNSIANCVSKSLKQLSKTLNKGIAENSQTELELNKKNQNNINTEIENDWTEISKDQTEIPKTEYEYYLSDYSFDQKYFDEFKARLKRHFEYEMRHYYELEIPENSLSDDKYMIFTSKAQKIDFLKFEEMRERSKEVKKEEKGK
jgi:putative DNA primase/helicase